VPHVPQLALSVRRSEQVPAQSTVPDGQVHVPLRQIRLPPQMSEQRPQLALFDERSTQALPHWVKPDAAHRIAQVPSLQIGVLPVQRFPHAPQFALLDDRSWQLPAPPRGPAHWVYPGGH
jgi:hypothetical protein